MKRARTPGLIDNPFVKPENKTWEVTKPASLNRSVSPPPTRRRRRIEQGSPTPVNSSSVGDTPVEARVGTKAARSTTAAVEAGEVDIVDHVSFFSEKLLAATRPPVGGQPRVDHNDWLDLYKRNLNGSGHHFVVHQHDHPVAGTHYDLRLQCNETSSISFAIMYGLPGHPNSMRLNRNATETRVHNIWNHLIETASHSTGTMLLWDTGEYEVLPYYSASSKTSHETDSDTDSVPPANHSNLVAAESESAKLHRAFQSRKIKLRLHGTRLPRNYTLYLRLTKENDRLQQPRAPAYKRRRNRMPSATRVQHVETTDEESESDSLNIKSRIPHLRHSISSLKRYASPPTRPTNPSSSPVHHPDDANDNLTHSGDENETIRLSNAYTGATNDIGSIHQRKWYLSLDRHLSGFEPIPNEKGGRKAWRRKQNSDGSLGGFEKFFVLGRDVETSVLTGRKGADVAKDEGVEGFVPRGLWRAVTE